MSYLLLQNGDQLLLQNGDGLLLQADDGGGGFKGWWFFYRPWEEALSVFKNTASQKIVLFAFDSATGAPKTGDAANLTAYVSKDDGAVTVLGDTTASELSSTNAAGLYSFDLTQAETNADKLLFSGKSSTSGVYLVPATVYTLPPSFSSLTIANGCVDADVERYGGTVGTFSGGRPEVNTTHIAGSAVSTSSAQIGVNVIQLSGDSVAADNAEAFFDGTGYAGTNNVIPLVTTTTNVTTVNGLAANVITATSIAADAITDAKVASDVTIASVTGAVGSVTGNVGGNVVGTVGGFTTAAKAEIESEVNDALVAQNLDHLVKSAVDTDFATTVHLDSVIGQLADNGTTATFSRTTDSLEALRDRGDAAWTTATGFSTLDAAGVRTAVGLASANLDTQLTAIDDYLDTEVAAIKAKTDQLTFTTANRVDSQVFGMQADTVTASALATDAVSEIQSGLSTLDAAGVRTAVGLASANLDTQLTAIDDYLDTEVAAIKAKTDNLPSDPADASDIAASFATVNSTLSTISGYLDTEVAAIKAKTDNLPASPAAVGSAMTLSSAERNTVADVVLRRTMASVEASSDGEAVSVGSVYGLIQMAQESSVTGTTLTVYKVDGSTSLGTKTVATDADADPVTGVS